MNWPIALGALGLIILAMTAVWLLSLRLRDASVVDAFWGSGFALLALFYGIVQDGPTTRQVLVTGLAIVWGVRLSAHILRRLKGQPEDWRYAAWRKSAGESFWWKSYFTVFVLQGLLMWVISAPLMVAQSSDAPARLSVVALLGVAVWTIGFLFETVGDAQLRRFKANPDNKGRVLQTGLWAYTRHPNYFGDCLVWWGFFLIAMSAPGGAWTVFSPSLMTVLLMRVSGVSLLESGLRQRRPGYAEYASRTSAFFPRRPRKTGSATAEK